MSFSGSDLKFCLSYLGAVVVFWKASAWVTRKQILVERFFVDVRYFMEHVGTSLHRIETNHLAHQEKYLKALAKAHGVEVDEEQDDALRQ